MDERNQFGYPNVIPFRPRRRPALFGGSYWRATRNGLVTGALVAVVVIYVLDRWVLP